MFVLRIFWVVIVIIQSKLVKDHIKNENITISLKRLKICNLLGCKQRPYILLLNGRKDFFYPTKLSLAKQ